MDKSQELREVLLRYLDADLERIIFSNPRTRESYLKLTVRPLLLRGALAFQTEEFTEKQAFQKNQNAEKTAEYLLGELETRYRNAEIASLHGIVNILISKKGTVTIKEKKTGVKMVGNETVRMAADGVRKAGKHEVNVPKKNSELCGNGQKGVNAGMKSLAQMDAAALSDRLASLSHNRTKKYVLQEGVPVPFLVDLGVMTDEGKVVKSRYDKFRQINRFLEFIEDVLPNLDPNRTNTIIDFGCGKSYLTFAMYYYLHVLKKYPIRVIGLDLKKDVIALCNRLSRKFGFENLTFLHGDIAGYEGVDQVDMVVTLHACDTATDYALAKAVKWGAKVILSVPCCQHEVNKQIQNDLLSPVLQYGLLKERMSALLTDGIRGQLLEMSGYRTQILEFIDMEHTPKNIMIRGIRQGKKVDGAELEKMMKELHVKPTLYELLVGDKE